MFSIIDVILGVLVLVYVVTELNFITHRVRKMAYQWWHTTWFCLLYSLLMYALYRILNIPTKWLFPSLVFDYRIEGVYVFACFLIWQPIRVLLRRPAVHNSLIEFYRKMFAKDAEDPDRALPFPYFYSKGTNEVKMRVGTVFYRLTIKTIAILAALVYLAGFISAYYTGVFFPLSGFGMLGLLLLIEYYIYLNAEAETEEEKTKGDEKDEPSDFDDLWRLYIENFDNYAVAWRKTIAEDDTSQEKAQKSNKDTLDDLLSKFEKNKQDGIISGFDLLTAFSKLVPFFLDVIKKGRYILVAFDIPRHFSLNEENSFLQEIASKLTKELVHRFPNINEIIKFIVYDEKSALGVLDNSIVMAPLSLISRQGLGGSEWMQNLGLITVVNVFDKGVSNLYETRKFCYLLNSVNPNYQILVVSAFGKELEPTIISTWITGTKPYEAKMKQYPRGSRQFLIAYNFEEWKDRFKKVLRAFPNDTLYSGSEMFVYPLSSRVGEREKPVTPVHHLELAYTSALEGIEELNNFNDYIRDEYAVGSGSIIHDIKPHVLPVDEVEESQVFSVIYDNENNSPDAYMKWIHLGLEENFSIIISKPYMFRDYFNANHGYFVRAPFHAVQPRMCKSKVTLAIILLNLLKGGKQDEATIKSLLSSYYDNEDLDSVPKMLKDLFYTYFSNDMVNDLRTSEVVEFDKVRYKTKVVYELVHPDQINLPYLDIITVKDENDNVLFDILQDLLFQNYSVGQHHSFSGWPYLVTNFDSENKTLMVTRDEEISNMLFYKPCLKVAVNFAEKTPIKGLLEEEKLYHQTGEELYFWMQGYETDVQIDTTQWIVFNKGYTAPKYSSGSTIISPARESQTPRRSYKRGKVLKVSLTFLQKPQYLERFDDIRKGLQILLYEGLQSLFPHHCQYLIVASQGDGDPDLPWIFNQFECHDTVEKGCLTYYFIEDAHIDLGLIGTLTKQNIWYLIEYIFDYLIWLSEDMGTPTGYDEYLFRKDNDKFSFLKYGSDSLPDYFDIDLLINFIRDYFTKSGHNLMDLQKSRGSKPEMGNCDFCGREMKNSEMHCLADGRMRCPDCSKDAVDTDAQFLKLIDEAKALFLTHLGIDFGSIPFKAKLVSAVELHKLHGSEFSITNGYDVRKLLGFAWNSEGGAIYVENGRKSGDTLGIIIHEMTHIWEFSDDEFKKIRATNEDWLEGLAVWTDLYLSEKAGVAIMEERKDGWLARTDEYGRGLKLILDLCPDDPYGYIRQKAGELH